MKYTNVDEVQVGQWVTLCCELDLYQITTEEELADVRESVADWLEWHEPPSYEWWESKLEALLEIRSRIPPTHRLNREWIAELDQKIAEHQG